ncbi:MAG TPA: AraC family transcriptional regulator [Gemmatimonadales bacterium]|nr:AraC family transcriptional regulator [Gemmatimonadales bacterium]
MSGPFLLESIVCRGEVTRRDSSSAAITSQALDWPGVLLEAGRNDVTAVDDLVGCQHYLSLNLDSDPLTLEVKESSGFRRFTIPPRTLWVSPSNSPITLRLNSTLSYLRVAIDPLHLGALLSPSLDSVRPVGLRRTYGVASAQMVHLMLALQEEADARNPGGLAVVEAITMALGRLLVRYAGVEPPRTPHALGGLSAAAKRRVLELIDGHLDARLTVAMLAGEVGLSPAHFARAFKQALGRAPHEFLLHLRLERARQLLELPRASLSDIAQRTGFADQAHFTRLFKRAYGITPGALIRQLVH